MSVVALSSSGGLVLEAGSLEELRGQAVRLLPEGMRVPADLRGVLARVLGTSRRGVVVFDDSDQDFWGLWELSRLDPQGGFAEDVMTRRDELMRVLAARGVPLAHIGAVAGITGERVKQIISPPN